MVTTCSFSSINFSLFDSLSVKVKVKVLKMKFVDVTHTLNACWKPDLLWGQCGLSIKKSRSKQSLSLSQTIYHVVYSVSVGLDLFQIFFSAVDMPAVRWIWVAILRIFDEAKLVMTLVFREILFSSIPFIFFLLHVETEKRHRGHCPPWSFYPCPRNYTSTSHLKSKRTLRRPSSTWTSENIFLA